MELHKLSGFQERKLISNDFVFRKMLMDLWDKVPFQRSESRMVIVDKVQTFNQDRYRNRLAYFTPLPWCTWFSPHLDNLYTALQLVTSDRFDGRSGPTLISLEQIVQEKQVYFVSITESYLL